MKKIIISLILPLALALTSCEKFLDINTDPNYPADASSDKLLAGGTVGLSSVLGGDMQLVGSFWSQFYTQSGSANQYWAPVRYQITTASYQDFWRKPYASSIKNLNLAAVKAKESGEANVELMSKVLIAFNFHILTSWYGDIPFNEVLKGAENPNPKFDDSKTVVVPGIIRILDEAIALAPKASEALALGENDMLYSGDVASWVKFAKTLKLKVLMLDFQANKTAITALLNEGDLLVKDAGLVGKFRDEFAKSNPLYESDRRGMNTFINIRATDTFIKLFNDNHDPRVIAIFEPDADGQYSGYRYGIKEDTKKPSSRARLAATDDVLFLSEVESYFLQAEAWLRLGDNSKAKAFYDKAVLASFLRDSRLFEVYTGVDNTNAGLKSAVKSNIESYSVEQISGQPFIAADGVYFFDVTKTEAELFELLIMQKYCASARFQGWNSYFDAKRTGIPTLKYNAITVPCRMLYPDATLQYNLNAPKQVPQLDDPQWWQATAQ